MDKVLDSEYNKNPQIKEDVKILRNWLKTQPHLPEELITDLDLVLAFHACTMSLESTKQVLDLHYTLRTQLPFLQNLLVDDAAFANLNGLLTQLPVTTPEGHKVIYSRMLNSDVKNFNFQTIMRNNMMLMDLWLHEEGTWPGFVFLIDMSGISLGHLTKLEITVLQHYLYMLQEAIYVKLKSVHFLNAPSFMDRLMKLIKPFLKSSIMDLIHVHQDHSVPGVPVTALPKEAGGEWTDLQTLMDENIRKLKANADFFVEQSKKVVDESKRPGARKNVNELFGTEGSFRKLDID